MRGRPRKQTTTKQDVGHITSYVEKLRTHLKPAEDEVKGFLNNYRVWTRSVYSRVALLKKVEKTKLFAKLEDKRRGKMPELAPPEKPELENDSSISQVERRMELEGEGIHIEETLPNEKLSSEDEVTEMETEDQLQEHEGGKQRTAGRPKKAQKGKTVTRTKPKMAALKIVEVLEESLPTSSVKVHKQETVEVTTIMELQDHDSTGEIENTSMVEHEDVVAGNGFVGTECDQISIPETEETQNIEEFLEVHDRNDSDGAVSDEKYAGSVLENCLDAIANREVDDNAVVHEGQPMEIEVDEEGTPIGMQRLDNEAPEPETARKSTSEASKKLSLLYNIDSPTASPVPSVTEPNQQDSTMELFKQTASFVFGLLNNKRQVEEPTTGLRLPVNVEGKVFGVVPVGVPTATTTKLSSNDIFQFSAGKKEVEKELKEKLDLNAQPNGMDRCAEESSKISSREQVAIDLPAEPAGNLAIVSSEDIRFEKCDTLRFSAMPTPEKTKTPAKSRILKSPAVTPGKVVMRTPGSTMRSARKKEVPSNLCTTMTSFTALVKKQQLGPPPPAAGKRAVRVKALEAAKAAKEEEEKKAEARKQRKVAAENKQKIELKEEENIKEPAVVRVSQIEISEVDKKRMRAEAERKERLEKRRKLEEVAKQREEEARKAKIELEEKERRRKALEAEEKEKKAAKEEMKKQKRLEKEREMERRRKEEEEAKLAKLAEKERERKRKEELFQKRKEWEAEEKRKLEEEKKQARINDAAHESHPSERFTLSQASVISGSLKPANQPSPMKKSHFGFKSTSVAQAKGHPSTPGKAVPSRGLMGPPPPRQPSAKKLEVKRNPANYTGTTYLAGETQNGDPWEGEKRQKGRGLFSGGASGPSAGGSIAVGPGGWISGANASTSGQRATVRTETSVGMGVAVRVLSGSPTIERKPAEEIKITSGFSPVGGPQSYEISPLKDSDEEDDDEYEEETAKKPVPLWARKEFLIPHLKAQQDIDPDDIFVCGKTCSLEEVFEVHGNRKRKLKKRGSSGNWTEDRLTWQEQMAYKKAMGYLK